MGKKTNKQTNKTQSLIVPERQATGNKRAAT